MRATSGLTQTGGSPCGPNISTDRPAPTGHHEFPAAELSTTHGQLPHTYGAHAQEYLTEHVS